jgi:hypothetical protein
MVLHNNNAPHTFHIPVMGTAFTIDTPLHVARYGISSVVSLTDDILIEQMRKYHCIKAGIRYVPIADDDEDPRANRITAYLNLLNQLVLGQMEQLRQSPFEPGSEITRYYEMLPDCPFKAQYCAMLETDDLDEKRRRQSQLRGNVIAGSIDANIMTKLDAMRYVRGVKPSSEYSDAKAALRGFARSVGQRSIVCSAGINSFLYKYFTTFDQFFPDKNGQLDKKITVKVSDFRSAEFQGNFFAKYGLWVSEYRIESGLNCGGHAFPTKGFLLGPILDEFIQKRDTLHQRLLPIYQKALASLGRIATSEPTKSRLTVQGGIGTAAENNLLHNYFEVDGTGWGTPFLLVPEIVNVDPEHMEKLVQAGEGDVYLSESSPLDVPFWNLRSSASENARERRIREGSPGSRCQKGYLRFDSEITERPVCRASKAYHARLDEMLGNRVLSDDQYKEKKTAALVKSCLCQDLAGGALIKAGIDSRASTAICPGPNIINFSKTASLKEMIDHIYGRASLISNSQRPHMFVKELSLYLDYYRTEVGKIASGTSQFPASYLTEFGHNLLNGASYYLCISEQIDQDQREQFILQTESLRKELERIHSELNSFCGREGKGVTCYERLR